MTLSHRRGPAAATALRAGAAPFTTGNYVVFAHRSARGRRGHGALGGAAAGRRRRRLPSWHAGRAGAGDTCCALEVGTGRRSVSWEALALEAEAPPQLPAFVARASNRVPHPRVRGVDDYERRAEVADAPSPCASVPSPSDPFTRGKIPEIVKLRRSFGNRNFSAVSGRGEVAAGRSKSSSLGRAPPVLLFLPPTHLEVKVSQEFSCSLYTPI